MLVADARMHGINLNLPRAVVLVDASDCTLGPALPTLDGTDHGHAQLRSREIFAEIVSFITLPHDTICTGLGNGEIPILRASNSRNLDEWFQEDPEPVNLRRDWHRHAGRLPRK
jgi:carbohydrate diacid regulator